MSELNDATQLLQDLKLGSALINVLFAIYDIDDAMSAKVKEQESVGPQGMCRSDSSSSTGGKIKLDEERFVQEQAHRLCAALDGVSRSTQRLINIGIEDLWQDDDSLLCRLALAILEEAAVDDYATALAMESGNILPAVTSCQVIIQHVRFLELIGEGADLLDVEDNMAKRCERVTESFVRQSDVDDNRESFAWRNGRSVLDKTSCQVLLEHPGYDCLFGEFESSCYERHQPVPKAAGVETDSKQKTVECVACCDTFTALECLEATCGHSFCEGCVLTLVGICVKDETSFPVKCCNQAMEPADIVPFLEEDLRLLYAAACLEFGTPAEDRIYCPRPKCSAFLGSASARQGQAVACTRCNISICVGCREPEHPGDDCEQNQLTVALRQLAEERQWRACPRCKAIIEKTVGCNHMVCRCTQEFCYRCGVPFPKTCAC